MALAKARPGKGHKEGTFVLTGSKLAERTTNVASQARVEKDAEPAPAPVPAKEVFVPAPAPKTKPAAKPIVPTRPSVKPDEKTSV